LQVTQLDAGRLPRQYGGCSANCWAAAFSPSAWMILARFSRSASAWRAMARCIVWGSSTSFTSTMLTLMPHGSVDSSMIF